MVVENGIVKTAFGIIVGGLRMMTVVDIPDVDDLFDSACNLQLLIVDLFSFLSQPITEPACLGLKAHQSTLHVHAARLTFFTSLFNLHIFDAGALFLFLFLTTNDTYDMTAMREWDSGANETTFPRSRSTTKSKP